MEYYQAPSTISGSIYGSTFFLATGFHGFHVIIGTLFSIICGIRQYLGHLTKEHHVGFEAAAWDRRDYGRSCSPRNDPKLDLGLFEIVPFNHSIYGMKIGQRGESPVMLVYLFQSPLGEAMSFDKRISESDPLSLLPCYFRREVTLSSRLRLYPTNESLVTHTTWRRESLSNNCLGLDGGYSSGYGSSGKARILMRVPYCYPNEDELPTDPVPSLCIRSFPPGCSIKGLSQKPERMIELKPCLPREKMNDRLLKILTKALIALQRRKPLILPEGKVKIESGTENEGGTDLSFGRASKPGTCKWEPAGKENRGQLDDATYASEGLVQSERFPMLSLLRKIR
ncbi:Cytochrome c oxidase [Artemisia annua]|uniref:Cytochrome c oxidase subunit 3 n=1 Tax=Artemisia annua TaxID=35608 RepID=A0A2U1QAT5_ARTAN|nr:Cytochrome c oxidase [Artemisia annua]